MDILWIILYLSVTLTFARAEEQFGGIGDSVTVELGCKHFELTWKYDQIDYKYFIAKVTHSMSSSPKERLMGILDNKNWTSDQVAMGYELTAKPNVTLINLNIDTVRAQDDGVFIATFINAESDESVTHRKNVTVIQNLQRLRLQFEDSFPTTSNPAEPIEVVPGTYSVKCIAEGSNPPLQEVELLMDGNEVVLLGKPNVSPMEGETELYKTTVMANVTFPKKETSFQLKCLVRDLLGDIVNTKLDLMVLLPENDSVQCEMMTSTKDKTKVTLVCTLNNVVITNVTNYALEIGNTGEIIPLSKQGNMLLLENITSTQTKLTMTLDDAKDLDFESNIYLVYYYYVFRGRKNNGFIKTRTAFRDIIDMRLPPGRILQGTGHGSYLTASSNLAVFTVMVALWI